MGTGDGEGECIEEEMSGLSSDSFGCEVCTNSRMGAEDGGTFAEASRNDKSDVFAALLRSKAAASEPSSSCSLTLMSGGASCFAGDAGAASAGVAFTTSPAKSEAAGVGST